MQIQKLLIANRGEIAIRIAQTCSDLGIVAVAVHSEDDQQSMHCGMADTALALSGKGVAAYLDQAQIIERAISHHCDAIHPGYGFLSENAEFAQRCETAGLRLIGPDSETLDALGDKAKARHLAQTCELPLVRGTQQATNLDQTYAFFDSLPEGSSIMLKAISGGGGRGMRAVTNRDEIEEMFQRCQSEALASFGNGELYAEQRIDSARHIEIQIIGDGQGGVCALQERECSLQRRHQKLVEVTPSPAVSNELRHALQRAAIDLGKRLNYRSLGTVEFLVDRNSGAFYFMEVNPRIQVEHTITEAVYGLDLVEIQLAIAAGKTLNDIGLSPDTIATPLGTAVQARVNLEKANEKGDWVPAGGTISRYQAPSGIGVRVDDCGFNGFTSSPYYDSLLAKVIVHSKRGGLAAALSKTTRKLEEFQVDGIATNKDFLCNILTHPAVLENDITTTFIDQHKSELSAAYAPTKKPHAHFTTTENTEQLQQHYPEEWVLISSPMQAQVVELAVSEGESVIQGQTLAVVEAMKMEHVVTATVSGVVQRVIGILGQTVQEQSVMICIAPDNAEDQKTSEQHTINIESIRQDLDELLQRKAKTEDSARPKAVAKRHEKNMRMARENIADLVDEGSFQEYGSLTIAAQRRRRSLEELIELSPADGLIAGTASINADLFEADRARCMVMSYDYTVFAGTQGAMNHKKTDRMLRLANQQKIPLVFFTEGGGGRPGDTDYPVVAGLDIDTWTSIATLSGQVPIIGITAGRCFAGNAALLGCSDVIIATEDSNIGMAGPAMIEGGGLGSFAPSEVGPSSVQHSNGVIDILVKNETEAVAAAKRYLSFFQGNLDQWDASDCRRLRHHIPENRLRSYDIRALIDDLADTDSVLELRSGFGAGMITALVRIEGRAFGLIANNSKHLGGAIDSPAADKASRFIKLCDAFDLPLINLCDTPGFMVGPEAEKSAQVRHFSRMFVGAANISIPVFNVVLRKGYGLGAMAMTGGSFHAGVFTVAWPTGEFGAMGLEGAVRLGFKKELEALTDTEEQKALFDKLVAAAYEKGKAINMASTLEIDEVIDPADTRRWIIRGLDASAPTTPRNGKKLRYIDTW